MAQGVLKPVAQPISAKPESLKALQRSLRGSASRQTSERLIGWTLAACGLLSILTTIGIVFILFEQALEFFLEIPVWEFLTGTRWTALFDKDQHFGVLPLVAGTAMISFLSMVVAIPLGLMAAVYLSEYASHAARSILKPFMELLAGIPTIVYGYFALTFITPRLLKPLLDNVQVYNALSAAIAVGVMVLPMIASLSEDSLRSVPRSLREGAYGLGATKLEVSTQIVMPAALSGIVAAVILAISRAIGETMIVSIAAGALPQLTADPRLSMQAMTGFIVQVVSGDVSRGSLIYKSLFAVGLLLFLLTLSLNIVSQWFVSRFREVYQ